MGHIQMLWHGLMCNNDDHDDDYENDKSQVACHCNARVPTLNAFLTPHWTNPDNASIKQPVVKRTLYSPIKHTVPQEFRYSNSPNHASMCKTDTLFRNNTQSLVHIWMVQVHPNLCNFYSNGISSWHKHDTVLWKKMQKLPIQVSCFLKIHS